MPRKPKEPSVTVTIDKVDHARLVAGNGVTFFAKFNKARKACQVSIGREDSTDPLVVSFDSIRAFARLIQKYTGRGA